MRQHPPRRTPALAARFAAQFNSGMSDGLAARFANFRRICEQAGRDPAEVRLSTTLPVCRGEAARRAAALGEAGARMLALGVFHLYDVRDLDHVRLLGREILPQATHI